MASTIKPLLRYYLTYLRGYHCKNDAQTDAHQPCVLCPEGFYCPDKATMIECGPVDVFCPIGSVLPTPVTAGYFTIDEAGPKDKRVAQRICEAGHYCSGGELKLCPKGHFCNDTGMTEPLVCGNSMVFCREGSVEPNPVTQGFYSIGGSSNVTRAEQIAPNGYFSKEGLLFPCPEGHYGNTLGLFTDDCSGICEAGWYCPPASTSPRQIACGSKSHICPLGSSRPQQVRDGYYTTIFNEEPCRPGKFRVPLPEEEVGVSSVRAKLSKDSCISCSAGTHKPTISGNSVSLCLDCGSRAYTTNGIKCECYQSATDKNKSTKSFYDWTSGTCVDITDEDMLKDFSDDFHEPGDQFTKYVEHPCEVGHYCQAGVRYKCAAGTFGKRKWRSTPLVQGRAKKGTTAPKQVQVPPNTAAEV